MLNESVVDQQPVAISFADVLQFDDLLTEPRSRRYVQLGGLVARLHFLRHQLFEAGEAGLALGLTTFRIRPHPFEFRLDRALARLFLARLGAEAFVFRIEPRAVVAFERNAAAAVEFENPAGDVVEEIAIVGDRDHGAGIFAEEAFEPRHALGVEVVGGFVEQQHVGLRQQQLAQRDAPLLAAGQVRNRGIPRRQPQRVGGDVERAVEIPAVRRVDLRLQIALAFEQRVHLVVGHRLRELVGDRVVFGQQRLELRHAVLDVAAHVLAGVELRFLRQEADLDAFLRPRFAVDRVSMPAMIRSSVDFPDPFKPSTPIFAPGKNDSEMFSRILRPPGTTLETRFMV